MHGTKLMMKHNMRHLGVGGGDGEVKTWALKRHMGSGKKNHLSSYRLLREEKTFHEEPTSHDTWTYSRPPYSIRNCFSTSTSSSASEYVPVGEATESPRPRVKKGKAKSVKRRVAIMVEPSPFSHVSGMRNRSVTQLTCLCHL